MTRKCFFVHGVEAESGFITLSERVSHHVENVLRCRVADAIEVRDGHGNAWAGEIVEIRKGNIRVRLLERLDAAHVESPLEIVLGLALARPEKMDLVIRQVTEMGVTRLGAFQSKRSQYGLAGEKALKRSGRWSKIVREAMCQCGRTHAPEIDLFESLDRWLDSNRSAGEGGGFPLKVFAWEGEKVGSLRAKWTAGQSFPAVLAAVGPEGGWDGGEVEKLMAAGFEPISLGPRILRYETAAIALISAIQLLWGDMGGAGQGRQTI